MSNLQTPTANDTLPTLSTAELTQVAGGDGQNPPAKVDGRDVVETGAAATKAALRPWSLLGNVPDAVDRLRRTDRVGGNLGDRALDAFTGVFGIDPLKKR